MDPPQHTTVRNLVGGAFSARRVEQWRPRIEWIAGNLLDRLIDAGPTADLARDFCAPLTFAVQCELLGVPANRRDAIRARMAERLGGGHAIEVYRAEVGLHTEVTEMITDRRQPPGGLLAQLIAAHRDCRLESDADVAGVAASLLFDGPVLAAAQLALAVFHLLRRPELADAVRAGSVPLGGVTEESLRYCPSVNLSMPRTATTDVRLGGTLIRAGEMVAAALPLANRDTAVFDDPDRFDAGRPSNKHLSFGHGAHHCIGAHLARVILDVALRAVLRRVPELRLAGADHELGWSISPTIRSLSALPVRWHDGHHLAQAS
jgi:cytochrome P450